MKHRKIRTYPPVIVTLLVMLFFAAAATVSIVAEAERQAATQQGAIQQAAIQQTAERRVPRQHRGRSVPEKPVFPGRRRREVLDDRAERRVRGGAGAGGERLGREPRGLILRERGQ